MAKLVKQQKQSKITGADTIVTFMEYFVTILCTAIAILVPLYMKNGYYEIGQCKYDMYWGITVVGLPLLLIFAVIYFILQRKQMSVKEMGKKISVMDIAVLCYLVCVLVSFCLSEYKQEAWTGYPGWNMGLYAQLTFVFLYFFVSRLARDYKAILTIMLGASVIVILLAVLNRFVIDPLGVYEGIPEFYRVQFLSTLGQTSWYSSFLCIALPIGIYAFWKSERRSSLIVTGVYILLGFMSLVTQNSDSAYFAFLGMMLVFLWFSLDEGEKTKKFLAILFLFGFSAKIVKGISLFADASVIVQLDKLSLFLINGIFPWILMVLCTLGIGAITFLEKKKSYPAKAMKILRNMIFICCGVGILAAVTLLVLSVKREGNVPWASIPYLVWSEHWGNARGFTWQFTWKMFREMNLADKLFGVGPESYPYYTYEFYKDVVDLKWGGSVLTNAHNEWLNAVINYGIVGGVSYFAIFLTGIVSSIKKAAGSPEMVMVIACVVAYVSHNFFCYQQVLCTPFIMIILGIAQYIMRKAEYRQESK